MQTTILPATAVKDENGQYDSLIIGEMRCSYFPTKVKCRALNKKQQFKHYNFFGNPFLEELYRTCLLECRKLIVLDRSLENLVCVDRIKDGKIARPIFLNMDRVQVICFFRKCLLIERLNGILNFGLKHTTIR